jgi:hypothetical protein
LAINIVYAVKLNYYTKPKSAGKPICIENACSKQDTDIPSHLNTKNDKISELLLPQTRAPPQISLFEKKQVHHHKQAQYAELVCTTAWVFFSISSLVKNS